MLNSTSVFIYALLGYRLVDCCGPTTGLIITDSLVIALAFVHGMPQHCARLPVIKRISVERIRVAKTQHFLKIVQ